MKKVLLSTAAIAGLAMIANPAAAQVELEVGGYFKGYGVYTDQDDPFAGNGEPRDLDIVRQTEVHLGGETVLDNGLTVGFHTETEADGSDSFDVQESYAYFSGGWGRVNFGAEDGAAYLLQVAAPSADSNVDGVRQFVNPVNYGTNLSIFDVNSTSTSLAGGIGGVDYDQDITGYADKLTYLSPIMNGLQLGVSYTPDVADASDEDAENLDDVNDALGEAYEAAVRYEGTFNNIGFIVGGGYSHAQLENELVDGVGDDFTDDQTAWNIGADLDIAAFGVGVSYSEDDLGDGDVDGVAGGETFDGIETFVVGADYTNGPFKIGASYLDGEIDLSSALPEYEINRYSGGVIYTYGPGMTFRGSVHHIEHDISGTLDVDATSVMLGTQVNF